MSQASPGPWTCKNDSNPPKRSFSILDASGRTVVGYLAYDDHGRFAHATAEPESVDANAKLIAAAPEMAAEITRLRDILDRISTEAPGAIPACNCGVAESCNCCEILHLLDIYNGRVPDGPYRRPQPVLTTYQSAT